MYKDSLGLYRALVGCRRLTIGAGVLAVHASEDASQESSLAFSSALAGARSLPEDVHVNNPATPEPKPESSKAYMPDKLDELPVVYL